MWGRLAACGGLLTRPPERRSATGAQVNNLPHKERGIIMPREIITFQCTECKERNYTNTKNKKTTTERLEFRKFCPRCRKHQPHRETK
jgi:large subunit ribosomal protein L33